MQLFQALLDVQQKIIYLKFLLGNYSIYIGRNLYTTTTKSYESRGPWSLSGTIAYLLSYIFRMQNYFASTFDDTEKRIPNSNSPVYIILGQVLKIYRNDD